MITTKKSITRSNAIRQLEEIQDDIEYMEDEVPFDYPAMTNEELLEEFHLCIDHDKEIDAVVAD